MDLHEFVQDSMDMEVDTDLPSDARGVAKRKVLRTNNTI